MELGDIECRTNVFDTKNEAPQFLSMMRFRELSILSSLGLLWLLTTSAAFCQYTFTKVVDTANTFPGNATTFTSFQEPVVHAGVVAFAGSSATNGGVFRWTNSILQKAADFSTTPPNGSGKFTFFSGFTVYVENGVVSFRGIGSAGNGIYQYDGATLTRLADTAAPNPAPGGATPFTFLYAPNMKDGLVGFIAETTNFARGIFLSSNGVMSAKLVPSTGYPGGTGRFALSSQIGLDDGNIAFVGIEDGNNTRHGIFTLSGGTLTKVAEKNVTTVPGVGGVFTDVQNMPPDVSGTKVAFYGAYATGNGIFAANLDGSGLTTLVSTAMAIPGGTGNFTGFTEFEYDNGDLVFGGSGASAQSGIYLLRNGTLTKILDKTTSLGGKTISTINFRNASYANGELAFGVNFTDATQAIYYTSIGAPVSGGTLGSMQYSAGTGASFSFTGGTVGQPYRIQYSTNLLLINWTAITNFTYTSPVIVTNADAPNSPLRFYRAITP